MTEAAAWAALGLVAGTWGAIIGAGGGFLIVPVLLLGFGLSVPAAAGHSLCAVCAGGAVATWLHHRRRDLDWSTALRLSAAAVPGAVAGALLARVVPQRAFSLGFGALLAVIGLAIARRPDSPFVSPRDRAAVYEAYLRLEVTVRRLTDAAGHRWAYFVDFRRGLPLAFAAGLVSSLAGIGGGVLLVPALVLWLRIPHPVAVGIASALLAVSSLAGAAAAVAHGAVRAAPVLALVAGSVAGARAGTLLGRRMPGFMVVRLLSGALVLLGARLLVAGVWR